MKQGFYTKKEVIKTEITPFTVKELSDIINKEKPELIYCELWNENNPFIVIIEYNQYGFMMVCNGWGDKSPKQYDAEKLHSFLKYQGLSDCYIK